MTTAVIHTFAVASYALSDTCYPKLFAAKHEHCPVSSNSSAAQFSQTVFSEKPGRHSQDHRLYITRLSDGMEVTHAPRETSDLWFCDNCS